MQDEVHHYAITTKFGIPRKFHLRFNATEEELIDWEILCGKVCFNLSLFGRTFHKPVIIVAFAGKISAYKTFFWAHTVACTTKLTRIFARCTYFRYLGDLGIKSVFFLSVKHCQSVLTFFFFLIIVHNLCKINRKLSSKKYFY